MIEVHSTIYRLLWIAMAVIGAMLASSPLMLLSDDVQVISGGPLIIASGVIGALLLAFSIWRLIRPLRPQQKE